MKSKDLDTYVLQALSLNLFSRAEDLPRQIHYYLSSDRPSLESILESLAKLRHRGLVDYTGARWVLTQEGEDSIEPFPEKYYIIRAIDEVDGTDSIFDRIKI